MELMLSIDFGNSFTKVAVRASNSARSGLLQDDSLRFDSGLNTCVPTLAARLTLNGETKWYFGTDVLRFKENTRGLTVYKNWKPRFFNPDDTDVTLIHGADAAAGTGVPDYRRAPRGISPAAWTRLIADLPQDLIEEYWRRLSVAEIDIDHHEIAVGFFRWLKKFFEPSCRDQLGVPIDAIPVRISLPSFGSVAGARQRLTEILKEAGWRPAETAPALAEPLANAIGIFTEGQNSTHRDGRMPDYATMFHGTGMLQRIRNAVLDGDTASAWILVIDVGGFTADYAMLGIDLWDVDAQLEGQLDGKDRLSCHSEPIGVALLDQRVRASLPPEKQAILDTLILDPNPMRLESFHHECYSRLRPISFRGVTIGKSAAEAKEIKRIVHEFADEIADGAEDFLNTHCYEHVDDVILTGGGTMIPTVREAICKRLSSYGVGKLHCHIPDDEIPPTAPPRHILNRYLVRSATAIGGSSIYFDFAE